MSLANIKHRPIQLLDSEKTGVRTQFGALCYRVQQDKVQILLITSRATKRWIVPKGWPIHGSTPVEAAETEATEEAGVIGRVSGHCLGIFSYTKTTGAGSDDLPCVVALFPIRVKRLMTDYPEKDQRRRKWVSQKKAATMVDEPELKQIIKSFDPRLLA